MNEDNTLDIAVVGGGIAGLAIAYYLQQQSRAAGQALRLAVLEQEGRPGGKLITDRVDGFVVDGGPDSFATATGDVDALCRELGLDDELIAAAAAQGKPHILSGGRVHPPPEGLQGIVPCDLGGVARSSLFSAGGKLRIARELTLPAGGTDDDESMAVFVRRRFGQEAVEKLAFPLLATAYLGDPEWLSMRATFPEYLDLEARHGSLIRGCRAAHPAGVEPAGTGAPAARQSFREGMGTLAERLAARLDPGCLRLNQTISHLRRPLRPEGPYRLETPEGRVVAARLVILALPAPVAASLLGSAARELAAELRQIRYLSSATVVLGYRPGEMSATLPGTGLVRAARESIPLLACSWTSAQFPGHAPPGATLIRAIVGGDKGAPAIDLPDIELSTLVRAELGRILGVTALPGLSRVFRWRLANPQYNTGHLARVARLEALVAAQLPGLFLAGSAYRGIDIAANIREARQLAAQVLGSLGAPGPAD